MEKFYKFNDEKYAKVEWRITDQDNCVIWRKKGLQEGGRKLLIKKIICYGLIGLFVIMPLYFLIFETNSWKDFMIIFSSATIFVSFFAALIYLGMLGGDVFNYRMTDTHFEQASWNDYIPLVKIISIIPLSFLGLAMFFMLLINPIGALFGMGGMAGVFVMASTTLYSKHYEKLHLNYQHLSTDWSLLTSRVIVDKKYQLIVFFAPNLNRRKKTVGMFTVFCNKHNFEKISGFIINKAEENQIIIEYKEAFA